MIRRTIGWAALLGCLLAAPAVAAQVADRATGCKVELPPEWASFSPRWSGPCDGGNAMGLGVLRLYDRTAMRGAFYGEMDRGGIAFGVIDARDGFIAGRFVRGLLQPTEDRNVTIRAFRRASDAARAASDAYRRENNAGSAAYYADLAKHLAAQMD